MKIKRIVFLVSIILLLLVILCLGVLNSLKKIDIPLDDKTRLYVTEEQLDYNYLKETRVEIDFVKFNILLAHNTIFIRYGTLISKSNNLS